MKSCGQTIRISNSDATGSADEVSKGRVLCGCNVKKIVKGVTPVEGTRQYKQRWRRGWIPAHRVRIGPRRNPGPIFLRGCFPWVPREAIERHFPPNHGKYRAVATLKGAARCRRSCHSKNRDRAGRWSASAPTRGASARPKLFPMQHLRRLSRRAGLRMGPGSRRPAAAPGARSSSVARQDDQRAPVAPSKVAVPRPSRRRMTTPR